MLVRVFLCACLSLGCLVSAQGSTDPRMTVDQQLQAQAHLLHDFGGLIRYGSENTEIAPPRPGENRVVFLGDEITELWGQGSAKFFPGKAWLNRGITGQTS